MSILVFKDTQVLIPGITGGAARHHTENMLAYGTRIVAGTRPGAGGQEVCGVPVYDSVAEACQHHRIDASILFIPAKFTKASALEALKAGIKLLVIVTEHVPLHDAMVIMEEKRSRARLSSAPTRRACSRLRKWPSWVSCPPAISSRAPWAWPPAAAP